MCTTVLVGKKASLCGSNIIARNEDSHVALNPKRFEVVKGDIVENRVHKSVYTGVEVKLPEKSYRFTAMPDVTSDTFNKGRFSEISVNEVNVVVSSTESLYGNERVLAYDPLVLDGIAEDAINDIVSPYVNSAREAVAMLGKMIEEYGSAEGNGVIFADRDEIWYMEIPTGHHWVAIKIPDDAYAIAPNCVCIEEVDLDSSEVMHSAGIKEFVESHRLNPDKGVFNFRHIFGTFSKLDRVYNTSRAWYGHRYLDRSFDMGPTDKDIPFIHHADRLVSYEDVEFILSSHYDETVYDPIGKYGTELEKTRFRGISLSRTQQSHVVQVDDMPITWIAMATTAFTPYVPFFSEVDDMPKEYRDTTFDLDLNYAYWIFKVLSYYVETHHDIFEKENTQYLEAMRAYGRRRVAEVKAKALELEGAERRAYLTKANQETVDYMLGETRKLLTSFMTRAISVSKMSFIMDKNL